MPRWPIVARTEECRRALEALQRGSGHVGVVLAGEAGVGKTTLACALAENLASGGVTTRFVLGTQTAQSVPLGAFHRSVPVGDPREPAVMLAAAHQALAGEENLVIVVDDAHLLDPLSAILVHQLAVDGTARMIVTIRVGDAVPDAVTALWKEEWLSRIDIGAFTRAQTGELARTVLKGAVDSRIIDDLHDLTSGSPLLLRGLLTASLDSHALVENDGRWRLEGPLRVGADLNDLLECRLRSLAADELEVVEIVAAAEVLDWDVLRPLCDSDSIARVERRGMIHFIADGSHMMVHLSHPILGEVVRRRAGVARCRKLNGILAQQLSEYLRSAPRGVDACRPDVRIQLQLAQFIVRGDVAPDPDFITYAAASAVTMSNIVLGEELARFAYERGAGLPAALVLADAMSWQGRGDEAEALLRTFDPDGADELATARWGCLRAGNLFFVCGQVHAARAVLTTVKERLGLEATLGAVTAMEACFALFSGDVRTAIAVGAPACAASGMVPTGTVWAAMATTWALALSGRFADVSAVAERGVRAAEQCDCGLQRFAIGLAKVAALTAAGDLGAAEQACRRCSAMTSGVPLAEAIVNAQIGRVELARGRLTAACEALQSSLSTMSQSLPPGCVVLVAAWSAQAEAARGNAEAAAAALATAEAVAGPQVTVFLPELELARAWERASSGEVTAARAHAERAAQIARHAGTNVLEIFALHSAVRFGDRSQAGRLRELALLLNCPLATAMATHGLGLAHHDSNRLDDAADQFTDIGAMALAADAAAHAAHEHARVGARINELESSTRAHWLASQHGLHTPATASIENPLPITDREREIATLVAAGLSNREIGDRLGVSVRTVEGHLYRIFGKLGIADRDELARLLRPSTAQWDRSNGSRRN